MSESNVPRNVHKNARVRLPRSVKLNSDELQLMQRAAVLLGLPHTAFMRTAIVQAARGVIAQYSVPDANLVGLPAFKLDFSKLRKEPEPERELATATTERVAV